jgi:simple sugar transport system permease protein
VTRAVAVSGRLVRSTTGSLLLATALALAVGALLIVSAGVSPVDAYRTIWEGSVGSWEALAQTSLRAAPLLVMALGLIPALRAGVFSIGSEGQFGIGALVAGLATLELAEHLPAWLAIVGAAAAGAAGGMAWALVPALLRAYLRIDEILTTFAFNFIATFLLLWLLNGPARGEGQFLVQTTPTPEDTWLPTIGDTVANVGLLLLPVLVVLIAAFGRTPAGYRVRLFGARPSLAVAARARPRTIVLGTMLLAGAAAGLAGWLQVAGVDRAVFATVFRGYGYLALALVALGSAKVLPTVVGALVFAALQNGSEALQLGLGVSSDFVFVMQGLVLFLMTFRLVGRGAG